MALKSAKSSPPAERAKDRLSRRADPSGTWTLKGMPKAERELAIRHAGRSRMTIPAWLTLAIRAQAEREDRAQGVAPPVVSPVVSPAAPEQLPALLAGSGAGSSMAEGLAALGGFLGRLHETNQKAAAARLGRVLVARLEADLGFPLPPAKKQKAVGMDD